MKRQQLTPVADGWAEFAKLAVTPGTPDSQITDMRRLFTAGAFAAVTQLQAIAGEPRLVQLTLAAMDREFDRFGKELAAWAAMSAGKSDGRA